MTGHPLRRALAGGLLLALALPVVTAALVPHRDSETLAVPVLLVLAVVVVASAVGGLVVALTGAVSGALLLTWFFTLPYGTFDVDGSSQLVVLAVYLGTALLVSLVTSHAAHQSLLSQRARAEADTLAALSGAALADSETLGLLLERIRSTFAVDAVLLESLHEDRWSVVDSAGTSTGEGSLHVPAGPGLRLTLAGPELLGHDQRLLGTLAGAAATALEGRRLAVRAAEAASFEAADRTRTALLGAVGHDLRAPLAVLRAASDGLLDPRVGEQDTAELALTVADATGRLQGLVENLLDASRLQAGVVVAHPRPHEAEELLSRALVALPARDRVHVEAQDGLPLVLADIGLTERILVNLLDNALRHSPRGSFVTLGARSLGSQVLLEVIDHGPGVSPEQRHQLFTAFQKRGDDTHSGLGLGLSVAQGFALAMSGALTAHDTVGGGLTLRLALPAAT